MSGMAAISVMVGVASNRSGVLLALGASSKK